MVEKRARQQVSELMRHGGMRGRLEGFRLGFMEGFQAGFDQARKEIAHNMFKSSQIDSGTSCVTEDDKT